MLSDFRSVLTGDVFGKGMTALSIFLAIRYFTPTELATYIYFAGIAAAACSFFNGFFNRQYLFDREHGERIAGYRLSAALLTFAGCAAILALSQVSDVLLIPPTIALALVAMDYEFKRTILQKGERFRLFAIAEPSRATLFFAMTVAVIMVAQSDRPALLLFAQAASYLVAGAFIRVGAGARETILTQARLIVRNIMSVKSMMLMAYFILVGLFGQLPILLYKPISTAFQYAAFGSAFRYFGLLGSISIAVNVVSLPKIANATAESSWAILASMKRVFLLSILLVATAVAIGFVAIPIVDGGAYPPAPFHFTLLSVATLIGVFVGPLSALYLRGGRLGFLLTTQIVAVGSAAAVIFFLSGQSYYWAAAALPIGIFTQLCALLAGSRRAYKQARGAAS